jgi:DNA polymerase-3 subunit epsilon
METGNFIAIDFETATASKEPCQLGIVIVKEWSIIQKMSYLIRPKDNYYEPGCAKVHGITPANTKNAPCFLEVWSKVSKYFDNATVIAHKADFDRDALYKAVESAGMDMPVCDFICTRKMTGGGLEESCKRLSIPLLKHHDALFDAEAAANIFIKINKYKPFADYTPIAPKKNNKPSKKSDKEEYLSHEEILDELLELNPDDSFIGKNFVVTGSFNEDKESVKVIIKKLGGKTPSSVSKSTNYVIIGENPGWKKMEEIDRLKNEGVVINTMSENEALVMINKALEKQEWNIYDVL